MDNQTANRQSQEEKINQQGRLPPGQSLTQKFPVLHYGPVPTFNPATWDFRIWGEVAQELRWTWDQFTMLPRTSIMMDIHCVTRWSKFDTLWEGVSLRTLVEQGILQPCTGVKYIVQHAEFGFTTNLPIEVMLADNFLLATHYNGEPITPEHGFPVRGVVGNIPNRSDLFVPYFWKGAKWLRALELRNDDMPGFWEQAGYHNQADVWKEQRFG